MSERSHCNVSLDTKLDIDGFIEPFRAVYKEMSGNEIDVGLGI